MNEQVNNLKSRIINSKKKDTGLTSIIELIRELGCFSDIIGRDFDVLNPNGKVVYTIRQKPISILQLNTLLKELYILKDIDNDREAAKWGSKK